MQEENGFSEIESHRIAQPLIDFQGNARDQLAEVIIRRAHLGKLSNDLGFARNGEGRFEAIVSDVDQKRFDMAWMMKLHQRYAYHVAREQLEAQGFGTVDEEVDDRGVIRLTLRRSA